MYSPTLFGRAPFNLLGVGNPTAGAIFLQAHKAGFDPFDETSTNRFFFDLAICAAVQNENFMLTKTRRYQNYRQMRPRDFGVRADERFVEEQIQLEFLDQFQRQPDLAKPP